MKKPSKKIDWFAWAFLICLIAVAILLINLSLKMKSESSQCLQSPFTFGAMKLEQSTHSKVIGSILIENQGSMYFNSTNMIAGERWQDLPP